MPATTLSNDMTMTVALRSKALLGESPIWCEREQALYWVDIHAPEIRRFDPATGADRAWRMPEGIGSIGFREKGGFVAALRSGFAFFDPATGALERLATRSPGTTDLRFNDGRCDRAGRFWAGTVQEKRVPGLAALYRFDPDGRCTRMADGLTVANGSAFSPDGKVMYFADSWTREIYAYDLDLRAGAIANRRVFARLGRGRGHPRRRHGRRRRLSVDRAFRRRGGSAATRRTAGSTASSRCRCRGRRAAPSAGRPATCSTSRPPASTSTRRPWRRRRSPAPSSRSTSGPGPGRAALCRVTAMSDEAFSSPTPS